MKCCDITASMLNRQILIKRRSKVADGMGGNTETFATQATVWAIVTPTSGRERAYAGRIEAQVDYKAIIRFAGDGNNNPSYTADDRVVFQGLTYGLEYVIDIESKRTWLELGMRAAK